MAIHSPLVAPLITNDIVPALIGGTLIETGDSAAAVYSPCDGSMIARVANADSALVGTAVERARRSFQSWRSVPAPRRGALVKRMGELLQAHKSELAALITLEAGKIPSEAEGEVQEMIDVCDFAVGLSRQLYGLTIASERPGHRMMEQWHPLGVVGVITAFNFPVAVWAWNAMIALVCGNTLVWKPSEQTPLCALACQGLLRKALTEFPDLPRDISFVVSGDADVGHSLAAHRGVALVSATGSCAMGHKVAQTVAGRLGRYLLELGGNNGMILAPSADLELALRAVVFAAVGTCGQRCTTLRRLIVHESIADDFCQRLVKAYGSLNIGDPRNTDTLVGPLINQPAYHRMQEALKAAEQQGGQRLCGGERVTADVPADGYYVTPAIVSIDADAPVVQRETFAPILYVLRYRDWDEAIAIHNNVPQGLSSAVFTNDLREAERFLGPAGSDCGIANVNIGTAGAEIGGAFGGEKDTGGGRESGSDAWKAYMRRATNTVNYGDEMPLAQGVKFEV